ncbi:MAG: sulfurtransferase [Actinobacteria bacterium]|nr:sulfurtransferase [Actinomycetota bacterium]
MIPPFVDAEWTREHLAEVVLVDSRWYADGGSGRDAYAAGHIPGAVFVDLDTALTGRVDASVGGRHPLAEPTDFAAAMGALGIGDDDTVIAYDDAGGVIAARLVWMLRVIGHEAALLDGGLAAWEGAPPDASVRTSLQQMKESANAPAAVRHLDVGITAREPATFTARPWPAERLVTIDEAAAAAAGAPLIDARPADRFAGAPDDLDPRAGHIPGARSVPCRENLDAAGKLLPLADLRARFAVDDAAAVISYCGSGVTACHNLLAMEQAGLGDGGRLFTGSWSQWSRDPARPVQTGVD